MKNRAPTSRVTTILESPAQDAFADPLSMMKVLPDSFGNASPWLKIRLQHGFNF
jgi:hypothetical protein